MDTAQNDTAILQAQLDRLRKAFWPGLPKWEQTEEEPQQDFYEAVAEEYIADKRRLDWLEANPESGEPQMVFHPPSGDITWRCDKSTDEYSTLRDAIDAAMQARLAVDEADYD